MIYLAGYILGGVLAALGYIWLCVREDDRTPDTQIFGVEIFGVFLTWPFWAFIVSFQGVTTGIGRLGRIVEREVDRWIESGVEK